MFNDHPRPEGLPPSIFLSYHPSFSVPKPLIEKLRGAKFRVRMDKFKTNELDVRAWYRWLNEQVEEAMWVLILCNATYARSVLPPSPAEKDKAVRFEGNYFCHRVLL